MKKVLITARLFGYLSDSSFEPFRQADIRIADNPYRGQVPTEQQLIEMVNDVDGIIPGIEKITAIVLSSAPRLKVISRFGTGIDNIDLQAVADRGIVLTKVPEVNSEAVADMAFGLMLALARKIPMLRKEVHSGRWPLAVGSSVHGKTLGIIGLGHVGRKVALRASGFDMRVLAAEIHPDHEFAGRQGIHLVSIEELLRQSDFVTLHCPLTSDTKHLIGEHEFSLMKPTAFIINTARGGLIDEHALQTALSEGKIAGAAADAFEKEPAGLSPLFEFGNFIGTPHIAFCTREVLERMEAIAAHNLISALDGNLPEHTVDLSRWKKGRTL